MTVLDRINPLVSRTALIFTAGLMWCGVGVMLITYAATWLIGYEGKGTLLFFAAGFLAAMPIHHFGFLRLATTNIGRLMLVSGKKSLFSFITPKSYLIIIFMVALGITLRHSSLPKQYLSVLYNGIGFGLFLSSIRYFRISIKLLADSRR